MYSASNGRRKIHFTQIYLGLPLFGIASENTFYLLCGLVSWETKVPMLSTLKLRLGTD